MIILEIKSGPIEHGLLQLTDGDHVLGRDEDNAIVLPSKRVSRKHATISVRGDHASIVDMGSSNGLRVNGKTVVQTALKDGDRLEMGEFGFVVRMGKSADAFLPDATPIVKPHAERVTAVDRIMKRVAILDWKYRVFILMIVYVLSSYYMVASFLINKNMEEVFRASQERAKLIVKYLALRNGIPRSTNNDLLLDIETTLSETGVVEAYISDEQLRIRAPIGNAAKLLDDGVSKSALLENKVQDNFPSAHDTDVDAIVNRNTMFVLAYPIQVWSDAEARLKNIGVAKIVYSPKDVIESHVNRADLKRKGFIIVLIPGLLVFGLIYWMTIYPIRRRMNHLDGAHTEETDPIGFKELTALLSKMNEMIPARSSGGTSEETMLGMAPGLTASGSSGHFLSEKTFERLINGLKDGVVVLNAQKRIHLINYTAVQLLKFPEDGAIGQIFEAVLTDDDLIRYFAELLADPMRYAQEAKIDDLKYGGPGVSLRVSTQSVLDDFQNVSWITITLNLA